MSYTVDGIQKFESTGETNRKRAQQKLDIRRAEIAQGRFDLLKKHAPKFSEYSEKYLESVQHPNTRKRYAVSRGNAITFFGEGAQLQNISAARIAEFIRSRRTDGVKASTINRDLRFVSTTLRQAERERFIARNPFDRNKFFQSEIRERRKPHILTLEEQEKVLSVAPPRIRVLTVLGVETGMRTGEMLSLRWEDIDFLNEVLQVKKSKTAAGIRCVPISKLCKAELLRWRNLIGPEYSPWVFPGLSSRRHKLQGGRKAWATTLRKAGLEFFPIYYLRHAFASRMTAAGVSPITIAQMLGHSSSSQLVPRYAVVLDQNRIDAMKKLESFRSQESLAGTSNRM